MGRTWKSGFPPSYQKVQICNFGLLDFKRWPLLPPFGIFPLLNFFLKAPLPLSLWFWMTTFPPTDCLAKAIKLGALYCSLHIYCVSAADCDVTNKENQHLMLIFFRILFRGLQFCYPTILFIESSVSSDAWLGFWRLKLVIYIPSAVLTW